MDSVTNSQGVTIEYDEKFLAKIREAFNKGDEEEITQEEMFAFFHKAYASAIDKGQAEVE